MKNTRILLDDLLAIIDNGELWDASCAVEELKNDSEDGALADFIGELENAIDNLRNDWKDRILDLQEDID
jgi:hypothetical protein